MSGVDETGTTVNATDAGEQEADAVRFAGRNGQCSVQVNVN